MPTDQDSLFAAATGLLVAAAQILDGTPAGAPAVQYVAHGLPAFDCPNSLIVTVGPMAYGDYRRSVAPGTISDPRFPVVPIVPFTVTALRCVNAQAMPQAAAGGVRPADVAKVQADAEIVYRDGWSLFCGLQKLYRENRLFEGYPCRAFEIDSVIPVSPEGGCLGWTVTVQAQLDGFDPPGA